MNEIQYPPSGQASVEQLQRDLQTARVVAAVGVGAATVFGVLAIMQWSTKKSAITMAQRDAYQDIVRSTGGLRYGQGQYREPR